jgi:hypothetical protein
MNYTGRAQIFVTRTPNSRVISLNYLLSCFVAILTIILRRKSPGINVAHVNANKQNIRRDTDARQNCCCHVTDV